MLLNKKLMTLLLTTLTIMSCSHMEAKRKVAAYDVGVIGGDGSVLLYYSEGDYIIVQNCEVNTILGTTPQEARANCHGRSNKVPVESFRHAIRDLVSTDRLDFLKPLTPDDVKTYAENGLGSSQMEAMVIELDKINAFITTYGAENANLVRKDELVSALKSYKDRVKVIKKINVEIDKAIAFITDHASLTLTKFGTDKSQFMYTVLKNFDPLLKKPCGLVGSIDERIKDCSYQETSRNGNFVLVTRTTDFKEVHKDTVSGIYWSDRLTDFVYSYDQAMRSCKGDLAEMGGIGIGAHWRVPSLEEYKAANTNGIKSSLPNMDYYYWTSTFNPKESDYAWMFNGITGAFLGGYRHSDTGSVRCVAVEIK